MIERRLTQRKAAVQLAPSLRQVERLCRAFRTDGASGLVSRKRGRPSNRKLGEAVRERALQPRAGSLRGFGPKCTLLVYVDDATSRLMELRFVASESAFHYLASTRTYLKEHGKPVAFYSDKASIFRVAASDAMRGSGITQFGRALSALN